MTGRPVVVIGGPTASGKSALALALAVALDGEVINADSMQVYRDLRVLTARPGAREEAQAPHRLYGGLDGAERCSAALWRDAALTAIAETHAVGRLPVVVGGTGLYLRALTEGLAEIPPVPPEVRADAVDLHRRLGGPAFHAALGQRDPKAAARLHPGDSQRLVRAFEVIAATGRSILEWQERAVPPPAGLAFHTVALVPPRERLYAACDARFAAMMAEGALDEVRCLAARRLDPSLPVMKAVGVPELLAHLRGETTLDAAVALARQSTRRYAKRQLTWFRHQWPPAGPVIAGGFVLETALPVDALPDAFLAAVGTGRRTDSALKPPGR